MLRLTFHEFRLSAVLVVLASIASGVGTALILRLINSQLTTTSTDATSFLWPFAGLIVLIIGSRVFAQMTMLKRSEAYVAKLRLDLSQQVLNTPLAHVEQLGAHRIHSTLANDLPTLANALNVIPIMISNTVVIATCFAYLFWLDLNIAAFITAFFIIGIVINQLLSLKGGQNFAKARQHQNALYALYESLTKGLKELKLSQARARHFYQDDLGPATAQIEQSSIQAYRYFIFGFNSGQLIYLTLLGGLLWVQPLWQWDTATVVSALIVILFIMSPIQSILSLLPSLSQARVALNAIQQLGLRLSDPTLSDQTISSPSTFSELALRQVRYHYKTNTPDETFTVGPVDLTIHPGELIFVVGGNGSGKTTLAKLMTGLYQPSEGEIHLNGHPLTPDNAHQLREHFAAVFFDFHLFDTLINHLSETHLEQYIQKLHLQDKVQIQEQRFSTTDLSQGQRKRLALLGAYLEDKPLYLFDEWAADQDPEFREVFYRQLLPELLARGKTVIAITHDDRYFHLAHRIIRLERGTLVNDETHQTTSMANTQTA